MGAVLYRAVLVAGLAGGLTVTLSVATARSAHAQVSVITGSVRGQLRDAADGKPAAGALVTATSTSLQGEQVAITDGDGLYFLTALPAGYYTLKVNYLSGTFTRDNVLIQVGKEAV